MLGTVGSLSFVGASCEFWPYFSRRSSVTELGVVGGTVGFWPTAVPSTGGSNASGSWWEVIGDMGQLLNQASGFDPAPIESVGTRPEEGIFLQEEGVASGFVCSGNGRSLTAAELMPSVVILAGGVSMDLLVWFLVEEKEVQGYPKVPSGGAASAFENFLQHAISSHVRDATNQIAAADQDASGSKAPQDSGRWPMFHEGVSDGSATMATENSNTMAVENRLQSLKKGRIFVQMMAPETENELGSLQDSKLSLAAGIQTGSSAANESQEDGFATSLRKATHGVLLQMPLIIGGLEGRRPAPADCHAGLDSSLVGQSVDLGRYLGLPFLEPSRTIVGNNMDRTRAPFGVVGSDDFLRKEGELWESLWVYMTGKVSFWQGGAGDSDANRLLHEQQVDHTGNIHAGLVVAFPKMGVAPDHHEACASGYGYALAINGVGYGGYGVGGYGGANTRYSGPTRAYENPSVSNAGYVSGLPSDPRSTYGNGFACYGANVGNGIAALWNVARVGRDMLVRENSNKKSNLTVEIKDGSGRIGEVFLRI
ncbi:hypothetical protein NE237_013509 [Protea cynaroides]|uniref:Uncharacterized protein n=1 Tax=Protea cynaroides TaxID=273540 RepID=A0A9Q0H139_9MAGN|nr:hypothetical protein NE237_013509 [Protea cynaroides]